MRRSWWVATALLVLVLAGAGSAAAQPPDGRYGHYGPQQSFRFRLGLNTPSGDSDFFDDTFQDFTGDIDDFEDLVGGVDYVYYMHRHVGLMLSGDYFEAQQDQSYRDFVDNSGNRISHTTTLEISPLTAGVVVRLVPEGLPVVPYVGAGGGLYVWRYEESGDFIDFGPIGRPVFTDTLEDDGAAFGYYLMAGLEFFLNPYFSVFAEGRWDDAHDDLGGDFEDLGTLDLAGTRVMGGIAWSF